MYIKHLLRMMKRLWRLNLENLKANWQLRGDPHTENIVRTKGQDLGSKEAIVLEEKSECLMNREEFLILIRYRAKKGKLHNRIKGDKGGFKRVLGPIGNSINRLNQLVDLLVLDLTH